MNRKCRNLESDALKSSGKNEGMFVRAWYTISTNIFLKDFIINVQPQAELKGDNGND